MQATLQLSRLPPEEMRDLVLAFRTFRAAHPRDPISLLEFAGEYHRRAFRQADPKSRA